ncbi:MAG: hypothetical protein D6723_00530 [Acidobacteria bacterium]|nr:MAG: hypothetical protein D6723_00530 [Acidobacteriota bacterium]
MIDRMTFDELMKRWTWQPLPRCPGRYKLVGVDRFTSLSQLLGSGVPIYRFRVAAARDLVLVAALDRGGLISYQRADGSFVHTLNTPEGFARKLAQLGIPWPRVESESAHPDRPPDRGASREV